MPCLKACKSVMASWPTIRALLNTSLPFSGKLLNIYSFYSSLSALLVSVKIGQFFGKNSSDLYSGESSNIYLKLQPLLMNSSCGIGFSLKCQSRGWEPSFVLVMFSLIRYLMVISDTFSSSLTVHAAVCIERRKGLDSIMILSKIHPFSAKYFFKNRPVFRDY